MRIVSIVGGILAVAVLLAVCALFFDALNWVLASLAAVAAIVSVIWTWHTA